MARQTLDRSVKYKRLVRALRIPRPHVRGHLETLWDVAHECGNPILGSPSDVEAAAEWQVKPGRLFAALRDGWIDERPDGRWEIHDYWDHAPEYVRKRRIRELAREATGDSLRETADNGGQRRTTAAVRRTTATGGAEREDSLLPHPTPTPPTSRLPDGNPLVAAPRKRRAPPVEAVRMEQLPESIRTDSFLETMNRWLRYKRERGEGYVETGLASTLTMLGKRGEESATAALEVAMAQSWQGPADPAAVAKFSPVIGRNGAHGLPPRKPRLGQMIDPEDEKRENRVFEE